MSVIVIFDIDGVVRDVSQSYRRALADTVEFFTDGAYRPSSLEIDHLKAEGLWNNDWEAAQEMVKRYFQRNGQPQPAIAYADLVAWFQRRYRGDRPDEPETWNGYICQEPLLISQTYLENLTQSGIPWGFFSGATRASATYILEKRLGLTHPPLIAMEDAPGKPDPTGLLAMAQRLWASPNPNEQPTIVYAGDTVADMYTVVAARNRKPNWIWLGVGIIPPHVAAEPAQQEEYEQNLQRAGASVVLPRVEQLTADLLANLTRR